MQKVLVIAGPTGVGKSNLGIELAKKYNGEIISGDSIQVYKPLTIGSAKILPEEMQGIKHHLIDKYELEEGYHVKKFQEEARLIMESIVKQGKLPIIVGGTGLYIKAALYDYQFVDEEEDLELKESFERLETEILYEKLREVDPISAEEIHPNNRKRIIRALMVAEATGTTKSELIQSQEHKLLYDAKIIGLTMDRTALYQRINDRVLQMIENGLEKEVSDLFQKDSSLFEYQGMQGIGYKEWKEYFLGSETLEEVVQQIQKHSRQFAKRQYTWFKNQLPVTWFDIEQTNWKEELEKELTNWVKE